MALRTSPMTQIPPRRPRRLIPWGALTAGLAGCVGLALTLMPPQGRIVPGRTTLAVVRPGWLSRVRTVRVREGGRVVPTRMTRDGLVPANAVAPGVALTVTARLTPLLDEALVEETTVHLTTPATPGLAVRYIIATRGRVLRIRLTAGAAALRVGVWAAHPVARHRGLARTWRLGPLPRSLGAGGLLPVWVKPRGFERWGLAGTVRWHLPLPLAVMPGPAADGSVLIRFNQPVLPPTLPVGAWTRVSPTVFRYTPGGAPWWPGQSVAVAVPAGPEGFHAPDGADLAAAVTLHWTLPAAPILRAQEILAMLGYLPLQWRPGSDRSAATGVAAIWAPPTGTFTWRWPDMPAALRALWQPDIATVMTTGALDQFTHDVGLPMTGSLTPAVWQALETALAHHAVNAAGYSWIYVSETLPETLTLWHNGAVVLTSLTNTGIPASPTALGTYPIYLRYQSQTMSGTNPDGTRYVDPGVPWVNYFSGGDAVHGFVRAAYGYPQSLGCVELPPATAARVWTYVDYGTLVTVVPPGSPRSPV
jgi:hypothetical protein